MKKLTNSPKQQNTKSGIRLLFDFLFDKELSIYSAALSFNIIFAFIPFLMLGFYIASFMPFFGDYILKVRSFLIENIAAVDQHTVEQYLQIFISNYEKIGLIGLLSALYANYIFLNMFDTVAQKVYKCEYRGAFASIFTYLIVFTLITAVISIPMFLLVWLGSIGNVTQADIFPIQLFLCSFTIFKIIPNRQINYINAITAAIVSTAVIEALRSVFVYYIFYTKSYLTIYGSFATLFLFFVWINISSHLLLMSMKFCAYLQDGRLVQEQPKTS